MSKYNFNRNFAIIIGINNYQNGIPELKTAKPDAIKLAEILLNQHKALKPQYQAQNQYEVQLFLNQRAGLKQLNQLIADFKQGQIPLDGGKVTVTKDDRLLFYFAGHGIALDALDEQQGPVGYLIPQDAISKDNSTYLPMQKLHDGLNELPCRHMLAILDCCFAGAFRWASLKREIVPKVKVYKERYDRFISDRAWQVITSAADDQKALDFSGLRKEEGNDHSPFAKALFEALDGAADLDKDRIITSTELYLYLRNQVETFTENNYKRQTPGLCPLKKHDKGEFIFLLPEFDRDNLEDAPPLNLENNPYRGLESYDEKHSHLFFGREKLIETLYEKAIANQQPLTLIVGASGTGKSSLMKAGLLPHLRSCQEQFLILDPMRPGESPVKALTQISLPIGNITVDDLLQNEQAFANLVERWSQNHTKTRLLLPIDQFEELITLCKSDEEKEQFLKLIKKAISKYPDKIHVVITLRLDFEAQFQTSVLKDFWNDYTRFVVRPMSQNEFREVIEKPALEKVIYFDPPSLVDELINDVLQMPGALPLLSFTLSELYLKYSSDRTRDNRALTKKDYEDLGRVFGSLTKRANQEYEKLVAEDPAYKNTVRRVMLRMISLQGDDLARRQVTKSELVYANEEENKRVQRTIKCFSEARLIVEGSNSQGEPYVEPAHDALVQGWHLLRAWKNEDKENITLQRRLTPDAEEWKSIRSKFQPLGLQTTAETVVDWFDRRLYTIENSLTKIPAQIARLWKRSQNQQKHSREKPVQFLWDENPYLDVVATEFSSNDNWLNQVEAEFVQESVLQKRRNISWRWRIAVGVILVLSGLTIFALNRQISAEIQEIKALIESSEALMASNQTLDARVVSLRAAIRLKDSFWQAIWSNQGLKNQVRANLQHVVYKGQVTNRLEAHIGKVSSVAFSPNDQYIVTVGDVDGIVRLWETSGKQLHDLFKGELLGFSSDGQRLFFSDSDNTVRIWDITGKVLNEFKVDNSLDITFNPDSGQIAALGYDGIVRFWDTSGRFLREFKGYESSNTWNNVRLAFSPNGQQIIISVGGYPMRLWTTSGELLHEFKNELFVREVTFSPDGDLIATLERDGSVRLWETSGRQLNEFKGREYEFIRIVFSPDSQQIAIVGHNDISIWKSLKDKPWDSNRLLNKFEGYRGISITSMAFSKDGRRIAIGGDDGSVHLLNTLKQPLTEPKMLDSDLCGQFDILLAMVRFSPDGRQIATGTKDGSVCLWDNSGRLLNKFGQFKGRVNSLVFKPDGKLLVGSSFWGDQDQDKDAREDLYLWETLGNLFIKFRKNKCDVYSLVFSSNGQKIATGGKHNDVCLWDTSGHLLYKFPGLGHGSEVSSVAFSPNGQQIVTGGTEGNARLWDISGKLLNELVGHESVASVIFSPDGQQIATGGQFGNVMLWDLLGHNLAEFEFDKVRSVAFSSDGLEIATSDDNENILLWQVFGNIDRLISINCDYLHDYLKNNGKVRESDRYLCDDVLQITTKPEN
ncbi:caspase family protein [Nostoc linckia FACHB-104]|nr:caspase family protein [Nostoc linckia FACHB-104]